MTITFFAQGIPKGQPRPRAFSRGGHARVHDPGTAEGWKSCVALAAKPHLPEVPLCGAIRLILEFRFPRPKSHFHTGKRREMLRFDAPDLHTSKPDADNLAKAVMDALTILGAWGDDAQIASLTVTKEYDRGPSGCRVTIQELMP